MKQSTLGRINKAAVWLPMISLQIIALFATFDQSNKIYLMLAGAIPGLLLISTILYFKYIVPKLNIAGD